MNYRHHTALIGIALLLVTPLGLSNQQASSLLTSQTRPLVFWEAVLPYGSEEVASPAPRAFAELGEVLATINALRRATGKKTTNIEAWKSIKARAKNGDLEDLLSYQHPFFLSSPDTTPATANTGRAVVLRGSWLEQADYQFSLENTYTQPTPSRMGDTIIKLQVAQGQMSDNSAIIDTEISLNMGTLLFQEMLSSMEAFHEQLNAHQASEVASLQNLSIHQQEASVNRLTENDLQALAKFEASTPALLATLLEFSRFDSIISANEIHRSMAEGSTSEAEKIAVSDVSVRLKLDLDAIKKHYPNTWDSLGLLYDHATFKTTLALPDNQGQLASFSYNANTQTIAINTRLHNGGIVVTPASMPESPSTLLPRIIYPTKLPELAYETRTDVVIDFYGLTISIEGISLQSNYQSILTTQSNLTTQSDLATQGAGHAASLTMNLNKPPVVKAKGALLHILPTWLIDALIPGTIETIITDAFEQIAYGNEGDGAQIAFRFSQQSGQHLVRLHTRMEMPYPVLQGLFKDAEATADTDSADTAAKTATVAPTVSAHPAQIFDALRLAFRKDFDQMAALHPYPSKPNDRPMAAR